jgi:hypothetical protein
MRRLLFYVLINAITSSVGLSQSLILSTDYGKNCIVKSNFGQITDNKFDLTLEVNWVGGNLKPVVDNVSVIGFDFNEIELNHPGMVKLVSPNEKIIAFNSEVTLTFLFDELFKEDNFSVKLPFWYASSKEASLDKNSRTSFSLQRPKDMAFVSNVPKGVVADRTPPTVRVIIPEGVEDGFKPIIDTTSFRVVLFAKDKSGIGSVLVNNQIAQKLNDSMYIATIDLRSGYENAISTVVTDNSGLKTNRQFSVECRLPIAGRVVSLAAKTKGPLVSDVDLDIPEVGKPNPMRFALIIGNEDYTSYQAGLNKEMNVEFAVHDAEVFKQYANKVLGIPMPNIIHYNNAKALEMHRALNQINSIIKSTNGNGEFFVFYAGHGFPDEKTREPYLIPVDVSSSDLQFAIKLSDFYKKLNEFPSKQITVFIDACFSGGGRELGLLAARGVKLRPREAILGGNIVVFSASSGDQSALPFKEKNHGMFTYHLLKILKDTEGNLSYYELGNYLSTNVSIRSVIENKREQNPQVNVSYEIIEKWKDLRFR